MEYAYFVHVFPTFSPLADGSGFLMIADSKPAQDASHMASSECRTEGVSNVSLMCSLIARLIDGALKGLRSNFNNSELNHT